MTWTKMNIKIIQAMYSTMEINYNTNKKIEKYYLSSNYHNNVLNLSIISLDIINCYESTAPNIGE